MQSVKDGIRSEVMKRLKRSGIKPKHQTLDYEISKEWKYAIELEQTTYELAPPGGHAKRAEKLFKLQKTISYQYCVEQAKVFQCICGTYYYHKPKKQ